MRAHNNTQKNKRNISQKKSNKSGSSQYGSLNIKDSLKSLDSQSSAKRRGE